jgi:molybdenum cofactor synthesis domain-containing protein
MLKRVRAEEAVGMILGYDVTQVIPGLKKGPVFKKGHRIREEDIKVFLDTGNEYIWVIELKEGELHEDEAALELAKYVSGENLSLQSGGEGRVLIKAEANGLLKVERGLLEELNLKGDFVLSTLRDNTPCKKGETVGVAKVIPLIIREEELEWVRERFSGKKVLYLKVYRERRVGVIVTGDEVYSGRIKDGFDQQVLPKLKEYGLVPFKKLVLPDDPQKIAQAIRELVEEGCDLLILTGGLSVDPGDVTREGVELAGASIVNYGAPVVPGTNFLYALLDGVDILGLPACVYYNRRTIFDVVLPRLLASERLSKEEIRRLGYGGLCLGCENCHFPHCHFGMP